MTTTHTVFRRVPLLVGHDVSADPALREGLERERAGWAVDDLSALGHLPVRHSSQGI